jgi:hydroxymethylpyrimidine pyrophosphatase-like HAD family hydrolase
MTTFEEFYAEMKRLKQLRTELFTSFVNQSEFPQDLIDEINAIDTKLKNIPRSDEHFILDAGEGQGIRLELDYELNELSKDNLLFAYGLKGLIQHISKSVPDFKLEIENGLKFLDKTALDYFITDRDGTINNYCGRYLSSVQAVYNALILSQFSKLIKHKSIIITAAPLVEGGLKEVSIQPDSEFIFAGSKGREFLDENGNYHTLKIEKAKQIALNSLHEELELLLQEDKYSIFNYIGSGLQQKYGEVALARQDKNYSIPQALSIDFKNEVIARIQKVDPEGNHLVLDDTGRDLEINLSFDEEKGKDFNKGHGIEFITKTLAFDLEDKNLLICGDTFSDVPMLDAARNLGAQVRTIFVTQNEDLKQKVRGIIKEAYFVSSPDTLVFLLYKYYLSSKSGLNSSLS